MKNLQPLSGITKPWLLRALTLLLLLAMLCPFQAQVTSAAPLGSGIPPGRSDRVLHLKFVEGTDTTDLQPLLPAEAWQIIQKIRPLYSLSKSLLKEFKVKGSERLKKEKGDAAPDLPGLDLWYEITLVQDADGEVAITLLAALPNVEYAGGAPLDSELPTTPDFSSQQGYLDPATYGIDAEYAWTIAGGTGEGVTIYDVEYYWLRDHEDLGKADDYPLLMDAGDTASYTTGDETHGTSVLGILIAGNNGFGVTGIAYGASIKLAPTRTVTPPDTDPYINRPNAILLAVADGKPGDVILIEQQEYVCGLTSYGPIEDDLAAFQAIQTATALGFVVVEAAGNSTVDLDQAACAGKFNRSTRDSGAIIVGAGDPPTLTTDRQRRSSSTYGNRVDLQGWGSAVVTTGGGYLQGGSAYPRQAWYTNNFTGTSAASPMVAGAAAVIQAIAIHKNSAPLSPWQVRDLLVEQGSPQLGDTSQHIGPRPNLKNAIDHLPQSAANLTVNITDSDNDGTCSVTDCSLREAIAAANSSTGTTITLAANTTYSLAAVDNNDATYGANGMPVITGPIVIDAQGAVIERASSAPDFRLFQVASGGSLTLRNATLRNGKSTGKGGAILNLGTTAVDSSTFTGSSAADGGALANQGGTLTVVTSTFNGNSATGSGGAIYNSGTLAVTGSTLAGNSAVIGGNLYTSGTAVVKNTLLVRSASSTNCAGTLSTASTTNLADDSTCGSSATYKTATEINLGTLASNGGPTQTMALLSGSAAIEAGNTNACKVSKAKATDQRGYKRFYDANSDDVSTCDIGAFEYGSVPGSNAPAEDENPPMAWIEMNPAAPDGMNGWYRSPVSVRPGAFDDVEVIDLRCALDPAVIPSVYTDLPESVCPYLGVGGVVSIDGPHTIYAAAMDFEGNTSDVVSASFQMDATVPVLTCPTAGPFLLNSGDQPVGPAGVDASVSGLDEALSTISGIVTTESVGLKSLTFTAFDLAGNQANLECSYNVIYDFGGFYPPVEPAPVLNLAEAGSAIPLKFSLAGDQGLDLFAAGFPTLQQVACDTLEPIGAPSATKPVGNSGLSYDSETGWYNYIWKTGKTKVGSCQALTLQLIDGTQHIAYFMFQ